MTMRRAGGSYQLAPRESAYTRELGQAVCARVAAGESLAGIGRDDGMPERTTIYLWVKAHPEFCAALREAQLGARVAARLRERSARSEMMAQALVSPRSRGGLASCSYTPEIGAVICERLADGESLRAICRDPLAPCYATVYNWIDSVPGFADMYVEARSRQADTLMDEVREVGLAATPKTVWADRLRFDTLRWLTARLAPKKYCEKILVIQAQHALVRSEAEPEGLTVIVKRYSDITPEEYARAAEGEP